LASLTGSVAVAERRLIELLDKYGKGTVLVAVDEMIERTEKAVRAEIARWPEGTWYAEAETDDDGSTMDRPLTVRCELSIKGGELYFDFSRTDDEVAGMVNAYYQVTLSCVLCTTFLFFGNELAPYHNEGSMRPVHVKTRKGTIVDCNSGALVAGAPAITGGAVTEVVLALLSDVLPDRAVSPYARLIAPIIVGKNEENNGIYVYSTFCAAAGGGAVAGYDGYQCLCDMGTLGVVGKTDAEEEMARFPWEIDQYEFRTDSHGAGRWRGAPGVIWEGTNESGDCSLICGSWDGFATQAKGQHGGGDTPLNKAYVLRGKEKIEITHPHLGMLLKAGDHLLTLTGGGAGVGAPEKRDPQAVAQDVKNELVSVTMARDVYGVAVDPETFAVDRAKTAELRKVGR
jgi:N-methylhydantoinase B